MVFLLCGLPAYTAGFAVYIALNLGPLGYFDMALSLYIGQQVGGNAVLVHHLVGAFNQCFEKVYVSLPRNEREPHNEPAVVALVFDGWR